MRPRTNGEIGPDFFARPTLDVARDLIGTVLAVGRCQARIVETEAYTTDEASHALTRRHKARIMHDTFGHVYVYRIYGVHWCLNFTTEQDSPGAVLIRAAEPASGLAVMARRRGIDHVHRLASGPGNLCRALGITLADNELPIGRRIHLLPGERPLAIATSTRVGITKAEDLPWRFYESGNQCVSNGGRSTSAVGG